MKLGWLWVAAVGFAALAGSIAGARRPAIPQAEMRVFRAVNRLPNWLYGLLWAPMQLGNLVVGTAVGLVVAAVTREWSVAVGSLLGAWLKLVVERLVRKEVQDRLAIRQRPGTSQPGAVLRGDVPDHGPSFPSGHVILVAVIGCIVAPVLPVGWVWVPFALTFLVMFGRVYVGAHNPLDVTAGLGAGLLLGGPLAAIFG